MVSKIKIKAYNAMEWKKVPYLNVAKGGDASKDLSKTRIGNNRSNDNNTKHNEFSLSLSLSVFLY